MIAFCPTTIPFGFTSSSGLLPSCFSVPSSSEMFLPTTRFSRAPFAVLKFSVSPSLMPNSCQLMILFLFAVIVAPLVTLSRLPALMATSPPLTTVPPDGIAKAVAERDRQMRVVRAA